MEERIAKENTIKDALGAELRALRSKLQANTSEIGDWKVVKALEYQLTGQKIPYDMERLNSDRQKVRDRINEIEVELNDLESR